MASYLLSVFTTKDLHVSCSLHVLASKIPHRDISKGNGSKPNCRVSTSCQYYDAKMFLTQVKEHTRLRVMLSSVTAFPIGLLPIRAYCQINDGCRIVQIIIGRIDTNSD